MEKIKLALALILFLMLLTSAWARDGDGMRVVPAQEILDKIERGEPVEYDHVVVEGDLDLSKLKLPKRHMNRTLEEIEDFGLSENATIVSSSIRITDSAINGNISFIDAIFINRVGFGSSAFKGDANFGGSAFNGAADFFSSTFNGTAFFGISTFNGIAFFGISTFNGIAFFGGSAFKGDANFGGSAFNSFANFGGSAFKGDANFDGSTFNSIASFMGSAFSGYASFSNSAFNTSEFNSAEFNKLVSFRYANFSNSTNFDNSRFKEDASFEGADFNSTLYLAHAKYDRLYIRWKNIKELGYDDAAYLALLENFKKLGYVEDYDACYYEYRRLHRDQPWSGRHQGMRPWEEWLLKRIDLGLQAFYGYGKKPIWPLLWSAGTIFFFGLIWRRAGVDGGKSRGSIFERFGPGGEEKQKLSLKEQLRALGGAMLFSSTLFLSGTRLFVDPPAMPRLEGRLAAHARGFFIAERVLGAFFSILFFLSISGTIVR